MIRKIRRHIRVIPLAAAAIALPAIARGQGDIGDVAHFVRDGQYRGAASCKQCHTQPTAEYNRGDEPTIGWCLMTEFSTWRTMDKHSWAYSVLEGPRGQKMGQLLGIEKVENEASCLSCHALDIPEQRVDPANFSKADGVNCEACHGPADGVGGQPGWFGPHSRSDWRDQTPAEKSAFGFIDLRQPEAKVTLCLSCHVGDAALGRIVTHPMYAAGHPPLPSIDVAAFAKNEPQHWRDQDHIPWWEDAPEDVREALGIVPGKLYETEVSLTGALLSLRESMQLIAARSTINSIDQDALSSWPELTLNPELKGELDGKAPDALAAIARVRWPEVAMTHMDCAACHHDLRYPGWRQDRGFPVAPGRPLPRNWSSPVIEAAIRLYGTDEDRSAFGERLAALDRAFGARPFGEPGAVASAAAEVEQWADAFYNERLRNASLQQESGPELIRTLCDIAGEAIPNYDTARQIASTISVTYREWSERNGTETAKAEQIDAILQGLEQQLNLNRYPYSEERDELSLKVLERVVDQRDLEGFGAWTPKALGYPADPLAYYNVAQMNQVLDRLDRAATAEDLRDAYVEPEFKQRLQEINNRGLKRSLEIAMQYDPVAFQQQIESLRALIVPQ